MTQKTTQPALDSNTPAKTAAETGTTDSASTGAATAKGAATTAGKTVSVKPAKNQPLTEQVKASALAGDDATGLSNGTGGDTGTDADANGNGDNESGTDTGVLNGDGDTDQAGVDGAGVSAHATIAADADAAANIGRTRAPVGKSTGKTADIKGELSPEIVELVTELRDTVKQLAPNRHTPKTLKRALSNVAAILQDIDSLYQQAE